MISIRTLINAVVVGVFLNTVNAFADDFSAKWDEADAKRMEAAEIGYEWRDTGKILKTAKEESEAGNAEKAMQLVAQALEQSIDAIAQAEREKDSWKSRVPQ